VKLGVRAALVDGAIIPGDVTVEGDRISRVGVQPAGLGGLAAPGLIDVQVNGFAGIDFTTASPDDYDAVAAAMAASGVTSFQPTLISLPETAYLAALERLAAGATDQARVLGMHLEGPFLSPVRRGAHDQANMVDPDPALATRLIDAGPVTHMTIAPELPGALDLIELLIARNVTVAVGHSDADAATAHAAFDRGARSVTHLFNAQRPWAHRDPGIAGAALTRRDVFLTAIVDGIHLAAETVRLAATAAGSRFVLMTDAIAAAGQPEGTYELGDRTVHVADGVCRLDDGTLAGSVLTMDQAVRNLLELGFGVPQAVAAATTAPAELVRRPELGTLRPGTPADVCILDDAFQVVRTIVAGKETFAS
jgi:N-acetylglucosamine-6-phosphate deacetylase